jgi:hypothetical protein
VDTKLREMLRGAFACAKVGDPINVFHLRAVWAVIGEASAEGCTCPIFDGIELSVDPKCPMHGEHPSSPPKERPAPAQGEEFYRKVSVSYDNLTDRYQSALRVLRQAREALKTNKQRWHSETWKECHCDTCLALSEIDKVLGGEK